jgi:hypothetical protein
LAVSCLTYKVLSEEAINGWFVYHRNWPTPEGEEGKALFEPNREGVTFSSFPLIGANLLPLDQSKLIVNSVFPEFQPACSSPKKVNRY